MKTVRRFDAMAISKTERTPQGFLKTPAVATRVGVFTYQTMDGKTIRELRHPDHVFKPDSMRSLAGIPVTNNHPTGMVHSGNAQFLTVGWTSDTVEAIDDKFLQTVATISDAGTIQQVESGKEELSCGYTCDLEWVKGTYENEEYDCIQQNIIYNHLAIVDAGRAGPDVRLRLDSGDAILYDARKDSAKNKRSDESMLVKVTVGEKEFEVAEEVKAEMEALKAKSVPPPAPAAGEIAPEVAAKIDAMQAKIDHLTSELSSAVKKDSQDADFLVRFNERQRVVAAAKKVVGTFKADASDIELKKEVIKKKSPAVNLDTASADYINARFDMIVERIETESATDIGKKVTESRQDGGKDLIAEARARARDEAQNAWKKPLSDAK